MSDDTQFDMIAKTLQGLEDVLADELTLLQAADVKAGRRMVSFRGDKALMYKANFCCRTALRILKPIRCFKAADADTVYSEAKQIEWDQYFSPDMTFAVDAVIYSEIFRHSKFVAYRVKDAIADYFNDRHGKRPSVRINRPDIYIHIHISHQDCTISLDSSGESLHLRGYRVAQGEAPLNEVLAAGMILKTGWRGQSHFVDPMCGSGTLLIEAAMIALNVAPGIYRNTYAFERWYDFDDELFVSIAKDDSEERAFGFKCFGSDSSPQALKTAEKNISNAGLSQYIELKNITFQQYTEAPQPGILVTNPPYGERIPTDDLTGLYGMLGERLKHVFTGYQAWILSYKDECFEKIGLRPSQKITLMNGQLDCEYRCYELFEGKNKEYKRTQQDRKPFERKERFFDADPDRPQRKHRPPFAADAPDKPYRKRSFDADPDRPQRKHRPPFAASAPDKPYRKRSFDADPDRPQRQHRPPFAASAPDKPYWKRSFDAGSDRPQRKQRPPFAASAPDKPYRKRSFDAAGSDRPQRKQRPPFAASAPDKPYRKRSFDAAGSDRPQRKQRPPFAAGRQEKPFRKTFDKKRIR